LAGGVVRPGRTRVPGVCAYGDGRVVLSAHDVFWVERPAGGSLIIPRAEEPRLTLRFPAGALAEPSFNLEGALTSPAALDHLTVAGQTLTPDAHGRVALKLRLPESGAGVEIDARFADG